MMARTVRLRVMFAKTKRNARNDRHIELGSLFGPNLSVFRIKLSGIGIWISPDRCSLTEVLDEVLDCCESAVVVVTVGRSVAVVVLLASDEPVIACIGWSSIRRL